MSDFDLDPLDDDIAALLREGRPLDAPPPLAQARVLAHVERAALGGGGGGGGSPGSPPPTATGLRALVASKGVLATLTFVLGGALGALGHAALAPHTTSEPARIVYVDRAVPATPSPHEAMRPAEPIATPPSTPAAVAAPAAPAARPTAAPTPSAGQLDRERAVLDVARTALGRGDGAAALVAIDEHAATFKHGLLAEEREALAVQALVLERRADDARARGERFRKRYAESLLLPVVEASLASIPQ